MLPLLPSWVISLLCLIFGILLFQRARRENNVLLFGKICALIVIMVMYALFSVEFFDIYAARVLSRYAWIIYLLAEITYHYGKDRWISKE